MPSSKAPTGIQTGPGRLPSSVAATVQGPSTVVLDGDLNYVQVVTANTTLARHARSMIYVQTQPGLNLITLPAAPVPGDTITVVDTAGSAAANNFNIAGNGCTINGTTPLLVNTNRKSITMTFNVNWFIIGVGP